MLIHSRLRLLFLLSFVISMSVQAMVYDNRYFPLYGRPCRRTLCKPSSFFADAMIMTAGHAVKGDDEESTIPGIFGEFDQRSLAQALVLLGKPNLIPDFQGDLIWKIRGKIQAEGLAFQWNQQISDYFSCGGSWFFMHVISRQLFKPGEAIAQFDPQVIEMLDETRREMLELIDITSTKWNKTGPSDIDFYIRFGNIWDYPRKFRRIDAGVKFGVMIPTGVVRDIANPASVPFGGDGAWGIYVSADGEFEAKEDWSLGVLARISQRFGETKTRRFQVAQEKQEQQMFGALVGPLGKEEGFSYAFAPYLRIEDLREGLGFLVGYTIAGHTTDLFNDKRTVKVPFSSIKELDNKSKWTQEYMTANLYYDFSKIKNANNFKPTISLMWDFPVHYLIAHNVPKMNRVCLGIEFDF